MIKQQEHLKINHNSFFPSNSS